MGFMTIEWVCLPGPGGAQSPPGQGLSKPPLHTPRTVVGWERVGTLVGTLPPISLLGTWLNPHIQLCRRDLQVLCPSPTVPKSPSWARLKQGAAPKDSPEPLHPSSTCDHGLKVCFGCAVSLFSGGADETMQESLCNLMEFKKNPSYSAT